MPTAKHPALDKRRTLCLVREDNRLLLGLKKRGFGAGRFNGFGGKLEPGETLQQAAQRELFEEAGIQATTLKQRALLDFTFADSPLELQVHVFSVTSFTGEPQETEEMKPQWFALKDIPYDQMWADDRHWLPLWLAGKSLSGRFHFQNNDHLLSYHIDEHPFAENHHVPADNLAVLSSPRPA